MFSRGLSEIVLIVKDVKKSARFYREVVGLTLDTEPTDSWAWLWAGSVGQRQRIGLHHGPLLFEEHSPHPASDRWGRVHYAFEVEPARLEEAVGHIRSRGVEIYGPTDFEWMRARSYYFFDPDGNLLEFWSPDPSSGSVGERTVGGGGGS